MPRWKKATLIQTKELSLTTRSFIWSIDIADAAQFMPGQFITFDLPIATKRLDRWRSYSISSIPNQEGWIELCIVEFETGGGSQYLFSLDLGSQVDYKGPDGAFTFPHHNNEALSFICTGTGVAPFKSMLNYLDVNTWPDHQIDLIFGCRTEKDILYRAFFEELQIRRSNFSYHVATSRDYFKGYRGYVHTIFEELYKGHYLERKYYLCGWQVMIDEASARLQSLGVSKEHINYELYG